MWDFFVILHPYYCTKENAMRAAGKPVSAGEVAKSLNADRNKRGDRCLIPKGSDYYVCASFVTIYEGVWNLKGKARENNTPKS